jgi:hypothetical protein
MTDRGLKHSVTWLTEAHREIDQLQKETQREMKETQRVVREIGRKLGRVDDKFGSYTEGLALPSMTKILTRRFHMKKVMARSRSFLDGRELEVDVLAYSEVTKEVYIVEVKSHLRQDAIEQMQRILREFYDFYPEHRDKKVFGILAALAPNTAPSEVQEQVLREGIYLARIHDDEFKLQVPRGFKPRAYGPPPPAAVA